MFAFLSLVNLMKMVSNVSRNVNQNNKIKYNIPLGICDDSPFSTHMD